MARAPQLQRAPPAWTLLKAEASSSTSSRANRLQLTRVRVQPVPPDRGLPGFDRLQCPEEVHEIPCLSGLQLAGERRHRRAIQAGHEDAVEILVGRSALEPRPV